VIFLTARLRLSKRTKADAVTRPGAIAVLGREKRFRSLAATPRTAASLGCGQWRAFQPRCRPGGWLVVAPLPDPWLARIRHGVWLRLQADRADPGRHHDALRCQSGAGLAAQLRDERQPHLQASIRSGGRAPGHPCSHMRSRSRTRVDTAVDRQPRLCQAERAGDQDLLRAAVRRRKICPPRVVTRTPPRKTRV
jgi:hypothetical protein